MRALIKGLQAKTKYNKMSFEVFIKEYTKYSGIVYSQEDIDLWHFNNCKKKED